VTVLGRLAALKSPARKTLLTALIGEPLTSTGELHTRVSRALPNYTDREVRDLLGQVFGLLSISASHGYEPSDVAAWAADLAELQLTPAAARSFSAFLTDLLSAPGITGLAKALDVSTERERVLHTVRLLTDMRPVFDATADQPLGAVILHTLRIEFYESGAIQAMEFALSEDDVSSLRESLDREDRKTAALSKMLQRAELTQFEISEPESDEGAPE
jgi:hypothetical protein